MADIPETTSDDDLSEVYDEMVVDGEDDLALDQGQFADVIDLTSAIGDEDEDAALDDDELNLDEAMMEADGQAADDEEADLSPLTRLEDQPEDLDGAAAKAVGRPSRTDQVSNADKRKLNRFEGRSG